MSVSKNNIIKYNEVIDYLLPKNDLYNYLNRRIDNSGASTSIETKYRPGYQQGNPNGGHAMNNFSTEWIVPTKDAAGKNVYTSVAQVNIAALIQDYLARKGYSSKKNEKVTVEDLVKIQSYIISYIMANVHRFNCTLNPGGAHVPAINTSYNVKNSLSKATFSTPTTYTPIDSNPALIGTIDPKRLLAKKHTTITAADMKSIRDTIEVYIGAVSTIYLTATSYCHSNCHCHNCCCSCSCGHGKWL